MSEYNQFCPAPWNSLYLEPNGKIENCCVGRSDLGNINDTDVKDIVLGQKNIKIQQDMLDNNIVDGCKWCHYKTDSLQSMMVERYPRDREDKLFDTAGNFKLEYLDARWSNTCNLACIYCGPNLSSLWAQELKQEHRIERDDKSKMLSYVLEHIKEMKYVYLAGGEPLLMKENEAVVEAIVNENPECRVLVNTNLLNIRNNRIFEGLTKLKNCEWLVSVEGMQERYEYIRYPGKWSEFESNLMLLKEKVGVEKVKFNMVFMSLNGLTMWDTVDWLTKTGFLVHQFSAALYNNGVYDGPFDIRHLPTEQQQQILDRMNNQVYQKMTGWQNCFDYVKELVYNESTRTLTRLQELDHSRKLNSQQVFPEIYQCLT
jgi:radical SAM protein with 4Fe4S-binding SPASM domain